MQVKTNKIPRMIFVGVLILIFAGGLFARHDPSQKVLAKPYADPVGRTLSNIGNWSYWIYNTGTSGIDPNGSSGGVYPRGTAGLIYTDGLVWGGYVRDSIEENPRVGGVTYNEGIQQGWIVTEGDGTTRPVAVDPNDDRAGMWRMRVDYFSLTQEDVRQDAAELNLVKTEEASADMMQDVLVQYKYDFENWPTDLGAPYYDVNGNGVYDKPDVYWVQEPDPADATKEIWVWKGVEADLDGNGKITVGEREEPGIAGADQVLFAVYNDMNESKTIGLYGAQPIGIELQSTTWAYNQPSATLGQLIFRKYLFINKSGVNIDSMFVAQWSDPDIGNFSDDYAGCDTTRSVGFGYTSSVTDPDYTGFNLPPATVGYDFFQGPMVLSPGDTAIFGLKKRPGYKNLPMTSFFFFAAGSEISDPPLGDYTGTLEWYNMLNGFIPTDNLAEPTPYIAGSGPTAGLPTKFPLVGDPTTQQGDVDGLGSNFQPGDRRIGLCSGPFWMTPGDSQEVVVAIIGGIVAQQGGDNRNAVLQMKLNSDFAQFIYDNLFKAIPRAPVAPKVAVTPMEDHIVLDWGTDHAAAAATEADDPLLGFNFEGYNVYQLPTATATREQATIVATFDVVNKVTTIFATKYVASVGDIITVPIQKGTDSGIQRYFTIEEDYINGKPLFAGNTYYFAVTGYNFNDDPTVPEPSLESGLLPAIVVVPQGTVPGTRYTNEDGDMLTVDKTGGSTGNVTVEVIDPAVLGVADYKVGFHTEQQFTTDDAGDTLGIWYKWYLINTTRGDTLLKQQTNFTGDNDYPITEGILTRVTGPRTAGLAGWDYDGDRWITGVNWGGQEFWGGLDIGAKFFGSTLTEADLVPIQIVWQDQASVDANGYLSKGAVYRRDLGYAYEGTGELPMEAFDVTDPEAPRKVNICFVEDDREGATGANANLIWDMGWNGAEYGANGAREYLFFMKSDYNEGADYNADNDGTCADVLYAIWPNQRGSRGYLHALFTMDIFANLPNTPLDSYAFTTEGVVSEDAALAKADVEKINVFPNPYYANNPSEPDRFTRFVTFNHLPVKATIRIFNLAGVQVRKLEKNTPDQFMKWNLQNDAEIPVASGMYIAFIDMPELGKEKILKLMIIQAQEQLKYF
jgi:hypothetical protein